MKAPREYVHYLAQGQLRALGNKLEARKISVLVLVHVFLVSFILTPLVADEVAPLFLALTVGSALHLVWCLVVVCRLRRRIRELKGGLR
ncbi:MAG: hypothetical protein WC205_04120 [Opitutaceae bacterium]